MANIRANIIYRPSNPRDNLPAILRISPSNSSSSPLTMSVGDTLSVTNAGSSRGNVTVSYGESGRFTANKPMSQSLTPGETIVFTAQIADSSTYIRVSTTSGPTRVIYVKIVANVDDYPSNWSFEDRSRARPGSYVYEVKEITGVNTNISVSVSGAGSPKVRELPNGSWSTYVTVQPGDDIQVRGTAPSDYNLTNNVVVSGGSASDTWSIATGAAPDPNTGAKIPSGLSFPVSLGDVGDFFGRRTSGNTHLSDYVKGGAYVPTLSENSGVPTGLPIALSNLTGSYTSIYFKIPPEDYMGSVDTTSSGKTLVASWGYPGDYYMGFSDTIAAELEFKIAYNITGGTNAGSTNIAYNIPYPNAYHKSNSSFNITATASSYSEGRYTGTVTIYARHPNYPSSVVSWEMNVFFNFFGP